MPNSQKSFKIEVSPAVMKWAIGSSGWKVNELARRLKIDEGAVQEWSTGKATPTIGQLEDLSRILKRPLAVFFLSEPPAEKAPPKDFRMLPDRIGSFDKDTILAVRRARRLQRISRELSENINAELKSLVSHFTLSSNPRETALIVRREFSISEETQRKWKDSYEAFNELRNMIEGRNVHIFQMRMPLDDARGFVLVDELPATIVVNSKDMIEARIFTLMHEFGHVLINESGISIPEMGLIRRGSDKVEKWCNEFAAEFLLPSEILRAESHRLGESIHEGASISRLSHRYKVSKSMMFYNLMRLRIISRAEYQESVGSALSVSRGEEEGAFGLSQDRRCLQEKGKKFIGLVASNIANGTITYHEAMDFLSVNMSNIEKVMSKAI
jgi:Zn-dependent peptidase ImmA (M78 family)